MIKEFSKIPMEFVSSEKNNTTEVPKISEEIIANIPCIRHIVSGNKISEQKIDISENSWNIDQTSFITEEDENELNSFENKEPEVHEYKAPTIEEVKEVAKKVTAPKKSLKSMNTKIKKNGNNKPKPGGKK